MRIRWPVAILVLAFAAGCASLIGLSDTTTVAPDAGADASGPSDGGKPEASEDPTDGEVSEASAEACAPGSLVSPDASLVKTTSGRTCGDPSSVVLANENLTIRLDYNSESTVSETWNGKYVTGCVGLDFSGGPFKALTVRARAIPNACGNDCTPVDGGGCGTGHWFGLFVRDGSTQKWLTTTPITADWATYTVALPPALGANPFLFICRSSANRLRDDVELDYVAACP